MVDIPFKFGLQDYDDAVKAMSEQDDRSAAIVAASLLEDFLLNAIKSRFLHSDKTIEGQFLKGYGPLASFRSRIDLKYFLGLYGPEVHSKMMRIKEIRNKMAHKIAPHTFSTQEIKDQLHHLPSKDEITTSWSGVLNIIGDKPAPTSSGEDVRDVLNKVLAGIREISDTERGKYMAYVQNRIMSLFLATLAANRPHLAFLYLAHL